MAKGAFFRDDLVQDIKTDENNAYLIVPVGLESVPREDLRRDPSDTVVDAKTLSAFFVDDDGVKHASNFAANAAQATGTFNLDRRGGNDRISRGTGETFDFTTVFTAGAFVTPNGSTGGDLPYKIAAVFAGRLDLDNSFNRIPADETDIVGLVLDQGWQRLESIDFRDTLAQDAEGLWSVKADAALLKAGRQRFSGELAVYIDQQVTAIAGEQAPGYSIERSEKQQRAAMADLRQDDPDVPTWDDLQRDLNVEARNIFDQTSGSSAGVSVTFNAAQNRIERTSGNWGTDGFRPGMQVTPDGSANNDNTVTIISTTPLNMKVAAEDPLTQEGPISVDVTGQQTLTGYKVWRGDTDEWDKSKTDIEDFMSESLVIEWYARVAKDQRDYYKVVRDATTWTASTSYVVDDAVYDKYEDKFYRCTEAHTSQSERTDDAAKWTEYQPTGITLTAFPAAQLEI